MDRATIHVDIEPALLTFATMLRERVGARRVLLFGSHARGRASPDSDYDLIVVARDFAGIAPASRAVGLRQFWYQAGGEGPLDLICLTPEEFARAHDRITLVATVLPESIDLLPSPPAH